MMRWTLIVAVLALASCGDLDGADPWTFDENQMPFDPSQVGATLDFTDGVTSVNANWLDNVVVQIENPAEALPLVPHNGNLCQFVDDPTTKFGDILLEVDAGFLPNWQNWCVGGAKIFNLVGGTGLTVEVRELDTFQLEAPSRTFTASWAAGDVEFLLANDRYLCIFGTDSGAGADKVDIIDLSNDTLVGTYTLTGTLAGAPGAVLGRQHLFVQTNTATATIYAVTLATATLDAAWNGTGSRALNWGVSPIVGIDDRFLYCVTADDLELINVDSGTQFLTAAGLGTATGNSYPFPDGKGHFLLWQATHLSKWVIADSVAVQLWEVETLNPSAAPVCQGQFDGKYFYQPGIAKRVHAYDADTGAEFLLEGSVLNDVPVFSDGMRLVVGTSSGAGDNFDGFAALKACSSTRRLRRVDHGGYGKVPFGSMPLVPADL